MNAPVKMGLLQREGFTVLKRGVVEKDAGNGGGKRTGLDDDPSRWDEPGALLFLGDGHARQGEGEVVGSGLETSMDVEFTVDLLKNKNIGWPRLENGTHVMVLGSARPLLEALQHATTELQKWLMADYGMTERGAQTLMGQTTEYEVANVVDPNFTVVAKIRKAMLPKRNSPGAP